MPEPLSGVEPPRLLPGTGSGPAAYTIPPQGHVHTARGDHDDRCRGRRTLCWCPRVDSNHHALTGTGPQPAAYTIPPRGRSEEHTSELQSRPHLVCRLLLEKK